MTTAEPSRPSTSGPPDFRDQLAGLDAVVGTVFVAGPPILVAWAGTVLLALMLAGPFLLLVTLAVALVAAAAVVALAAAILATPYLLVRHVRAHRRHATGERERQLVAVTSQEAVA